MKAKIYIGAKKYALYIGRKIVQKTLEFLSLPARFVSKKVQELKNYIIYGQSVQTSARTKNLFDPAIVVQGNYTSDINTRVCGKLDLKNNTDFTISITGDYDMFVNFFNKGTTTSAGNLGNWFKNNVTIYSDKINTDLYDYVLIIRNYSNTTLLLKNFDGNIQLEEGTQATPFVPYIATTPTPQTPIPVESVGDRTKNLYRETLTAGTKRFYVTSSGVMQFTTSASYMNYLSSANEFYIKVNGGETLTITNSFGEANLTVATWDKDGNFLTRLSARTNTVTLSEDVAKIVPYFYLSDGFANVTENDWIQVEIGDTATPYEPYGYKVPVVVSGKNLFDKSNAINVNGSLLPSGEISYNTGAGTFEIEIKPNTKYSISIDSSLNTSIFRITTSNIKLTKDATIQGTSVLYGTNQKTETFITDSTAKYLYFQTNKAMFDTVAQSLQLEQGDTATPYQPYVAPTTTNIYLNEPLRKIGEYADYIDFENQKVVRNIGNKQLGSLTWSASSFGLGRFWSDGVKENVNIELPCFSNIFVGIGIGGYTENSIGYEGGANKGRMYVGYKLDEATKNDFVNMLNNTNAYIYYPFATPTEESITLPAIELQEGTLMLDISTDIKPSKMIITGDIDNE